MGPGSEHQAGPERPPMNDEMMALRGPMVRSADADLLREMIGSAA